MVCEGIVLGYLVLERGIEVDKAKIEVIEQLPPPMNVNGIHSFLGCNTSGVSHELSSEIGLK